MAGILDGFVKGIVNLAPQDNPDVRLFNAQNELKDMAEKETELFAELGKKVYEDGGQDAYPEIAARLNALNAEKAATQQKIKDIQAEKDAAEAAASSAGTEESGLVCPECGTANPAGTKFCHQCGTKLATE